MPDYMAAKSFPIKCVAGHLSKLPIAEGYDTLTIVRAIGDVRITDKREVDLTPLRCKDGFRFDRFPRARVLWIGSSVTETVGLIYGAGFTLQLRGSDDAPPSQSLFNSDGYKLNAMAGANPGDEAVEIPVEGFRTCSIMYSLTPGMVSPAASVKIWGKVGSTSGGGNFASMMNLALFSVKGVPDPDAGAQIGYLPLTSTPYVVDLTPYNTLRVKVMNAAAVTVYVLMK